MTEPYSDFTARQTVLRLLELIYPGGTSSNNLTSPLAMQAGSTIFESVRDGTASTLVSEVAYEEVEVAIPTGAGRKGKNTKKDSVKVRREVNGNPDHPFQDWKWRNNTFDQLPLAQPPLEALACVRAIQLSQFNPPQPHLRQLGHQLYLQVALLEGETSTLVCTTRGWYVSKSNVNQFDPASKSSTFHSLLDLLHSISPKFSERLNKLTPLSSDPPSLEPLSTVPIPQAEPAYPFLANLPKVNPPEILRTQLAYLHTGSTTADGLESTRDWNEEIQGIKDLPRGNMQERSIREKMLQKTLQEFTQASVRGVLAVAVSRIRRDLVLTCSVATSLPSTRTKNPERTCGSTRTFS
jgi:protein TIF31